MCDLKFYPFLDPISVNAYDLEWDLSHFVCKCTGNAFQYL